MVIGGDRDEKDMNYREGDGMISKIHPSGFWIPDDPRFTKVPHKTTCSYGPSLKLGFLLSLHQRVLVAIVSKSLLAVLEAKRKASVSHTEGLEQPKITMDMLGDVFTPFSGLY